jgi:ferredoxin
MSSRLRVDWIRCDGYGLCGDLLPDLLDLDEWRYPILPAAPIDGSRRHEIQRAIDCCPMGALILERPEVEDGRGNLRPPGRPSQTASRPDRVPFRDPASLHGWERPIPPSRAG